jgi:hypothetical protein
MRFLVDVVMAFARTHPDLAAATDDFFILDPRRDPADPDAHNSRGKDDQTSATASAARCSATRPSTSDTTR